MSESELYLFVILRYLESLRSNNNVLKTLTFLTLGPLYSAAKHLTSCIDVPVGALPVT